MCTASRYSALLLVDCPGALNDLAHDKDLAQILRHFKAEASMSPICYFIHCICEGKSSVEIYRYELVG